MNNNLSPQQEAELAFIDAYQKLVLEHGFMFQPASQIVHDGDTIVIRRTPELHVQPLSTQQRTAIELAIKARNGSEENYQRKSNKSKDS